MRQNIRLGLERGTNLDDLQIQAGKLIWTSDAGSNYFFACLEGPNNK